jgi:hypothetical protein
MTNQRLTVWHHITVEFSGHPFSGSYTVEGGMVKVKTPHGEKETQVGTFNSEWVARRLLEELVVEGKRRKKTPHLTNQNRPESG